MTQPNHRPDRQGFTIHAGAAEAEAILPEWWGGLESEVETRSLRFPTEGGIWLTEGLLPPSLIAAGCRLAEVTGVNDHPGLTHPSLEVGGRVLLQPDPTNPQDHNAISVWVDGTGQQIGYLPGDVAAEIMADSIRRQTGFGAFVAGEVRDVKSGERRALSILLGPGAVWAKKTAE